ncbi:hypothetical protein AAIB41_01920 [Brucella sp. BE17]|uniref:hypothetical protein n=1 Tax=Brucella sp. BE17 TaxID=3142977 RepID=UPI0031BBAF67
MADGCPERFDWDFLKWSANYRNNGRVRALKLLDIMPDQLMKHHLRHPREVVTFLKMMTLANQSND